MSNDTSFGPSPTVSAAVASRRSIRAFLDRPVDPLLLRRLLALAARAPSGGNLQPWRITLIGGEDLTALKQRIAERLEANAEPDAAEYPIYPATLDEPHRSSRYRVGEMLYSLLGIPREDKQQRRQWFRRNYKFFGAPVGLFCHVGRDMGRAQWSDLGMFLQTFMLLLREHGLDSCAQECWAAYHLTVDAFLKPADGLMLFCGMSIGYADPLAPQNALVSEREPLDVFASFRGI